MYLWRSPSIEREVLTAFTIELVRHSKQFSAELLNVDLGRRLSGLSCSLSLCEIEVLNLPFCWAVRGNRLYEMRASDTSKAWKMRQEVPRHDIFYNSIVHVHSALSVFPICLFISLYSLC